eukprot:5466350-Pyramimonas_sp.AAC.1
MFSRAQSETRQRLQQDNPDAIRTKLKKRLRSLITRSRLWAPFGRKLPLQGIRDPGLLPDQECAGPHNRVRADPAGVLSSLSDYWGQ